MAQAIYSPAPRLGGPASIPDQSWNLWWTKWQFGTFFSPSASILPCPYHSTHASFIHSFITDVIVATSKLLCNIHQENEKQGLHTPSSKTSWSLSLSRQREIKFQAHSMIIVVDKMLASVYLVPNITSFVPWYRLLTLLLSVHFVVGVLHYRGALLQDMKKEKNKNRDNPLRPPTKYRQLL